ncbi:MAG: hypothetical protein U0794_01675 [Isosphaeraceae bacterium]
MGLPRPVVVWVILALTCCALTTRPCLAQGPPASKTGRPTEVQALIARSQVTLETNRVAFQGTVIERTEKPPRLRIVTAAHGLFPLGEGTEITVRPTASPVVLRGTVAAAVPNPGYKPVRARDPRAALRFQGAIGSDNSVVTVELTLEADDETRAFHDLHIVRVVGRPIASKERVAHLNVHILDRNGVEHAVTGSTSMNPRWLAWGRVYHPRPGDSGAGVFAVLEDPEKKPWLLLLGNVVASDEQGGIAALFSAEEFPALRLEKAAPAQQPAR